MDRFTFRLPLDMLEAIKAEAKSQRVTPSEVIRAKLVDFLQPQQKTPAA
jgi:hypothetical protein